jgi:hypothetical protein
MKKTTQEFIEEAKLIHGDKYDYSLVEYKNWCTKIKIICPIHGEFYQSPDNHKKGHGCRDCQLDSFRYSQNEYIEKANKIHKGKYDYTFVEYKSFEIKIKIICPIHGEFFQTPHNHLRCGCKICKSSKGENIIQTFLNNNKIKFIPQKTFDDCIGKKNMLPFDFYLPKYNLCIEFQGEQHFKPIEHFGGKHKFQKQKCNDEIKRNFCSLKGIRLLEITYKDDVEKVLNQFLCENSPNSLK